MTRTFSLLTAIALVAPTGCGGSGGGTDQDLAELYDTDSAWRVQSQLACSDIELATQYTLDGQVTASDLLPASVLLAVAEPVDRARFEAAQTYFFTIVDIVWRERIANLLAIHAPAMLDSEYRTLIRRAWVADTRVALADVQPAINTLCTALAAQAASGVAGPTAQGFVCPRSPRPDCAADPPSEPWGCPPPDQEDCPDCPGLQDAEDDLKKLEELFEAARADEQFDGLIDALLDALLDAIESGDPPTPGSLALSVASAVLGPDYPGLVFYVDVLTNTISGFTAGGPLGGMAAMAWAILSGWGDFVDGSERLGDIEDARGRLNALRAWCERINWAAKQEKCNEFQAELFAKRTEECASAAAMYDADYTAWEVGQQECDAARAAVDAANEAASSMTARLQGSEFAFTEAAFLECCDTPLGGPKCPPADTAIVPEPFPEWAQPVGFGPIAIANDGAVKLRSGGDHALDPLYARGITGAVSIWSAPGHDEILLGTSDGKIFDIAGGGDFATATPWATFKPNALLTNIYYSNQLRRWIVTDLINGEVHLIDGGGNYSAATPHAYGMSFPVATITLDDGTLLTAVNGSQRVVDSTAGGDLSSAAAYVDLAPYMPQHFARVDDRLLLGAALDTGDGALFDITVPAAVNPSVPFATGIFNPSGMAVDPWSEQFLVCSFNPACGEVYDATDVSQGRDYAADTAFATGLTNPDGITFALQPLVP